jgi:hypothetical protein
MRLHDGMSIVFGLCALVDGTFKKLDKNPLSKFLQRSQSFSCSVASIAEKETLSSLKAIKDISHSLQKSIDYVQKSVGQTRNDLRTVKKEIFALKSDFKRLSTGTSLVVTSNCFLSRPHTHTRQCHCARK